MSTKIFQDDGLSYTPEVIDFTAKFNRIIRGAWRRGKLAGFSDADLYMIIMRDANLTISTTMFSDRMAKWEKRNRETGP